MANELKVDVPVAAGPEKIKWTPGPPKPRNGLGRNLVTAALPDMFTDAHDEMLRSLYTGALAKAHSAVSWYAKHVGFKRAGALFLRFGAITLAAVATLIPIAAPLIDRDIARIIPFASICAALAATFVAVDRFFGFSTGWMRYTSARFDIQTKIERFQMAWSRLSIQAGAFDQSPLSPSELQAASWAAIQELVDGVAQTVQAETQSWMAEFKGALAEIDKSLEDSKGETTAGVAAASALKVSVEERDKLDEPRRVTIRINNRPEVSSESPVYVVGGLAPGQYVIRVASRRGGKDVTGEDVVALRAGETGTLTIKLG